LSFIQSILPRHSLPFSYTFYIEIIHFNRSFTSKGFYNTNIVFHRKNELGTIHIAFSPKQFLLERIPAIFRRFGLLNMLNLLNLQAELIDLQQQFWLQCRKDEISQDPSRQVLSKWLKKLRESKETEREGQYKLLQTISEKLEKYSKCCYVQPIPTSLPRYGIVAGLMPRRCCTPTSSPNSGNRKSLQ
jgi:hypothetical protein